MRSCHSMMSHFTSRGVALLPSGGAPIFTSSLPKLDAELPTPWTYRAIIGSSRDDPQVTAAPPTLVAHPPGGLSLRGHHSRPGPGSGVHRCPDAHSGKAAHRPANSGKTPGRGRNRRPTRGTGILSLATGR